MLEVPYVVVDVFTEKQFGGNQLAVITDARGLETSQMQQIAAEFNFAETTFVLPPEDPANAAQVRIFTRAQEVPFAGHPNVGTAYVLARQADVFGARPGQAMRFEEKAGLVDVALIEGKEGVRGAEITAPQELAVGNPIDPAAIAACIGLEPSEILLENHVPVSVSVGLPFYAAEVSLASLAKTRAHFDAFSTAARSYGFVDLSGRFSAFVYARLGQGIARLQARMFAPLSGNFEDPATGSASAALGAYLATLDPQADGVIEIDIAQGVEMGRPSKIGLRVIKEGGRAVEVKISGHCVQIMQGLLRIQ
ncbi:PhzF family phenazine biosynthesis protein [Denitrobaculum tricleocarpae]|uniref:PhzF family phenazine biosynthesis protein n=1 Tax=Denitrobaculum tricleocarpae TaxID=2591009 RepID=A0A545TTD4_9PROT|nr:PhzF family phenazine biosynthesis protein [Denitrobaculum tricleocarpae]TQV80479.1 PhzF family phenazine biosynthesis protein [Denitrobaculum tricleocarpae]